MSWQRYCASSEQTTDAGCAFARVLRSGDIVLLSGSLGAGKTVFSQGVAKGLGVTERVTSPTFAMVHQHHCENSLGVFTLYHADVYRVESIDEVVDLALGELVEESGVALVEWGELAASVFGRSVITVRFAFDESEGRRLIVDGELAHQRSEALSAWEAT